MQNDENLEVVSTTVAGYSGRCTVDPTHAIRRGEPIGRVRRTDNPFIPIPGYACRVCLKMLPRAQD